MSPGKDIFQHLPIRCLPHFPLDRDDEFFSFAEAQVFVLHEIELLENNDDPDAQCHGNGELDITRLFRKADRDGPRPLPLIARTGFDG